MKLWLGQKHKSTNTKNYFPDGVGIFPTLVLADFLCSGIFYFYDTLLESQSSECGSIKLCRNGSVQVSQVIQNCQVVRLTHPTSGLDNSLVNIARHRLLSERADERTSVISDRVNRWAIHTAPIGGV